jgi:hypothetical protein
MGNTTVRKITQRELDRIEEIRNSVIGNNGKKLIGSKRNIAYLEGRVNGKEIGEILGVSGRKTTGVRMPSKRKFSTTSDIHPREFDAEIYILENLASKIDNSSEGTIFLVSERKFCWSCNSAVRQFRNQYPNIHLVLIDGVE